jgi:hypothetical protein
MMTFNASSTLGSESVPKILVYAMRMTGYSSVALGGSVALGASVALVTSVELDVAGSVDSGVTAEGPQALSIATISIIKRSFIKMPGFFIAFFIVILLILRVCL